MLKETLSLNDEVFLSSADKLIEKADLPSLINKNWARLFSEKYAAIELESASELVEQIIAKIGNQKIYKLKVFSHGKPGHLKIGSDIISLNSNSQKLLELKTFLSEAATVVLKGCSIGGQTLVKN